VAGDCLLDRGAALTPRGRVRDLRLKERVLGLGALRCSHLPAFKPAPFEGRQLGASARERLGGHALLTVERVELCFKLCVGTE
jgi:hypothetical protein